MKKQEKQTFNLHFTDYCNYNCRHCFVKKESKELTLEQIKKIVDKIADYQKEKKIKCRINLAGGEPMCSPNIQAIIDYINSKKLEASIITNGSFLKKEFIIKNKNKLSMIGLNIDSFNEETNRIIGRCCNNITLPFRQVKELCQTIKANGIKLKINCCVSKLNINDFVAEYIKELKPDRVKFLRVMTNHLNYSLMKVIGISSLEWLGFCTKYKHLAKETVFEDNKYMETGYLIIDSEGNLGRDNLHLRNNALYKSDVQTCLNKLNMKDHPKAELIDGAFAGTTAEVLELDKKKKEAHVRIEFFGRKTAFWEPIKNLIFKK